MVMSLYPRTQQNKKLADVAVKMLDAGIVGDQITEEGVAEGSDDLNYFGNCTDDDVIEHIFGDATGFAQAVEDYGDEFVLDDLVVKYNPETDVHSFYYKKQGVEEATLVNDPEQGHLIQPDGGMGTWDEQSLLSNLTRKFSSMVEMIKEKRYSSLYHSLYEAGVVENMLKALVEYENFKTKQGNRPIAKGREIDISESTDYISEK
jgi:hypothetical protein